MASGIYALVNTTDGKRYIGRTVDLKKKQGYHHWQLTSNRHHNPHLQRAWNRGDTFEFEIIEECDKERLNEREIYWIAHYKTTDMRYGYNLCEGGKATTGRVPSEETRRKISTAKKGKKYDPEVVRRRAETFKRRLREEPEFRERFINNARECGIKRGSPWNIGRKASEETRKKLSKSLRGKPKPESQKQKLRKRFSGENSVTAKLTERDVVQIRLRFLSGERQCEIHKDYPQITPQTLYDIVRCRRWQSVPNTIEELKERL